MVSKLDKVPFSEAILYIYRNTFALFSVAFSEEAAKNFMGLIWYLLTYIPMTILNPKKIMSTCQKLLAFNLIVYLLFMTLPEKGSVDANSTFTKTAETILYKFPTEFGRLVTGNVACASDQKDSHCQKSRFMSFVSLQK